MVIGIWTTFTKVVGCNHTGTARVGVGIDIVIAAFTLHARLQCIGSIHGIRIIFDLKL
jgi:hypothetical protein